MLLNLTKNNYSDPYHPGEAFINVANLNYIISDLALKLFLTRIWILTRLK